MKTGLKMAMVAAAAVAMVPAARGQYTGTSHPEQVPITTNPATNQATYPETARRPSTFEATAQTNGASEEYPIYRPTPTAATATVTGQMTLQVRPAGGTVSGGTGATRLPEVAFVGERPDADAGIVTQLEGPANELPAGTLIKARLREAFSTTETVPGGEFHAELTEPVERDGRVLLPAGAIVSGRVTDVHGGRRISGAASIHLQPTEVTMPDGVRYRIVGQVVDTGIYHAVKVDDEGTIVRKDHAGKTLAVMGLATTAGVVTGAVVAGVPGAVVGGLVGAGVGTVVWLKQDRQTALPAGTLVVFSLNQALVVGVE